MATPALSGNNTALAAPPPAPLAAPGETAQYLTFLLEKEAFAIGILVIKEILEYRNVTVVPMMPDWIRGVINLRGAVVPVIDLTARFGRGASTIGKRTCIVIMELEANGERQITGMMVDAVNQVVDIPASEIEPPPAFGARIRSDFIRGMGKIDGKFVILLDANRIGSLDEPHLLEAVAQLPDGGPR